MQLPQTLKIFPQFFTAFLKFTFNFEHLEKKDEPHNLCISEVIDGKKRVYEYVQRVTI